jgi:hypothetical protein
MKQSFTLADLQAKFTTFIKKQAAKHSAKTSPDPSAHGFDTETETQEFTPKGTPNRLIKFTRFCLFFAAGLLIVANIKPYINIVSWIGSGLADVRVVQTLSQIPLLNWALSNGGMGLAFIAGFLLWGLLQGLQMLPKIILNDPEALLVLMAWVSQFKAIAHKSGDSELLRKLKYRFNNLPLEWLEGMQQARAIAYVVDGLLCFGYYPPIIGGYDRLGVFIFAPSISDLDISNIIAALATMFGIEVLYEVSKQLKTALEVISQAQNPEV